MRKGSSVLKLYGRRPYRPSPNRVGGPSSTGRVCRDDDFNSMARGMKRAAQSCAEAACAHD